MNKLLIPIMVIVCAGACGFDYTDYNQRLAAFKSSFDPQKVDNVETFIRGIAVEWDLRVFEKNRDEMKIVTQGKEAFFIAFYYGEDAILNISNVGVGVVLTLEIYDYGEMSLADLNRLADQIRLGLRQELGIDLLELEP